METFEQVSNSHQRMTNQSLGWISIQTFLLPILMEDAKITIFKEMFRFGASCLDNTFSIINPHYHLQSLIKFIWTYWPAKVVQLWDVLIKKEILLFLAILMSIISLLKYLGAKDPQFRILVFVGMHCEPYAQFLCRFQQIFIQFNSRLQYVYPVLHHKPYLNLTSRNTQYLKKLKHSRTLQIHWIVILVQNRANMN